jgi:hypothetical protein
LQYLFAVLKAQGAGDLPSAFLELFGKAGGAAGSAIEVRLKAIVDAEKQVNGADRLAGCDYVLHVPHLLQVEGGLACREDAPIDCVVESLFGGE